MNNPPITKQEASNELSSLAQAAREGTLDVSTPALREAATSRANELRDIVQAPESAPTGFKAAVVYKWTLGVSWLSWTPPIVTRNAVAVPVEIREDCEIREAYEGAGWYLYKPSSSPYGPVPHTFHQALVRGLVRYINE